MEKNHFQFWLRLNLDRFGNPAHLLVRSPPWAKKLSTACGGRPERDVFDQVKPSWKNAYKIKLGCPECERKRLELINEEETARARELYQEPPENSCGEDTA